MQKGLQLSWRNLRPSEAIADRIRALCERLERFDPRLTGAAVTLESIGGHHRQSGAQYRVRVELSVPGARLVVGRDPAVTKAHADLYAALNAAFHEARRQLEEHAHVAHRRVKTHAPPSLAKVARLFRDDGYGFLRTPDDREIYFHEHAVLHGGFARLRVGTTVRFVEEAGDEGPQASTVTGLRRRARVAPEAEPRA